MDFPLRSAMLLIPASSRTTPWKYCMYNVASCRTFFAGALNGSRPATASTVETAFPNPISVWPVSVPWMLMIPAPGSTDAVVPGTSLFRISAMAPPSGYHDPPWGPVMIRSSRARASPAKTTPTNRPTTSQVIPLSRLMCSSSFTPCFNMGLQKSFDGQKLLDPQGDCQQVLPDIILKTAAPRPRTHRHPRGSCPTLPATRKAITHLRIAPRGCIFFDSLTYPIAYSSHRLGTGGRNTLSILPKSIQGLPSPNPSSNRKLRVAPLVQLPEV